MMSGWYAFERGCVISLQIECSERDRERVSEREIEILVVKKMINKIKAEHALQWHHFLFVESIK